MIAAKTPPGIVQSAPFGSYGFDTDSTLTRRSAASFTAAGFRFAVRYLSLGERESARDLTWDEAREILKAGLALMAIQRMPDPGWHPSQQLGMQYGRNAVQNAQAIALPPGVTIWLALDGVDTAASEYDVTAYCNAWFRSVSAAQYVPGIRIGAQCLLDGEQLSGLNVEYYWKSGVAADSEQPGSCFEYSYPANGYCMVQSIDSSGEIDNIAYHGDVIQADNCARMPMWLTEQRPSDVLPKPPSTKALEVPSSRTKSGIAKLLFAVALTAVLAYAAGLFSSPQVLPKIQSAFFAKIPARHK